MRTRDAVTAKIHNDVETSGCSAYRAVARIRRFSFHHVRRVVRGMPRAMANFAIHHARAFHPGGDVFEFEESNGRNNV